jgi:hypothetical protein
VGGQLAQACCVCSLRECVSVASTLRVSTATARPVAAAASLTAERQCPLATPTPAPTPAAVNTLTSCWQKWSLNSPIRSTKQKKASASAAADASGSGSASAARRRAGRGGRVRARKGAGVGMILMPPWQQHGAVISSALTGSLEQPTARAGRTLTVLLCPVPFLNINSNTARRHVYHNIPASAWKPAMQ